jgi:hypothetical protein
LTWRHAAGNCDAKRGGNHGRAHADAQRRDETALRAYEIFDDAMYQGCGQTEALPVAMQATVERIADGWVKIADVGCLDASHCLFMCGGGAREGGSGSDRNLSSFVPFTLPVASDRARSACHTILCRVAGN